MSDGCVRCGLTLTCECMKGPIGGPHRYWAESWMTVLTGRQIDRLKGIPGGWWSKAASVDRDRHNSKIAAETYQRLLNYHAVYLLTH